MKKILDLQNLKDEDLLNAKQLSQISPFGRDRTYALVKKKMFPAMKIGSRYYVTYGNWRRWLNEYEDREVVL